jgi:signal transduction histidine kinase
MAGQGGSDAGVRKVLEMVPELLRRDRPRGDVVLDVIELARSLFGSSYAVGGLLRDDGSLMQSTVAGLPGPEARKVRSRLGEVSLVAELVRSPDPVVRSGLTLDVLLPGLPTAPVSFLGHRVTVDRKTVGMLYVVGTDGSGFTDEDERLMRSLSGTLGAAMENRALLRDAMQARRWLHAAGNLAEDLFSTDLDQSMKLIGDRARELAEADIVALAVIEDDAFRIKHLRGLGQGALEKFDRFPIAQSPWAQAVVESRRGAVVSRLPESERQELSEVTPPRVIFGPAMLLPLLGAQEVLGVLFLARHDDSPPFTESDAEVAGAFANRVGVLLEVSSSRQLAERVRLFEDRNRIARDLHDHVVQRLFATGLSLQQVLPSVAEPERARVDRAVHTLDETIREIRNTILTLRSAEEESATLQTLVTALAVEAAPLLGFAPLVALQAPSGEVSGTLAVDLSACIREGLSNAVRHAKADHVEICSTIERDELVVTLSDNGVGIHSNRRSGLDNLAKRMKPHDGRFSVEQPPEGGTVLSWRVPLAR